MKYTKVMSFPFPLMIGITNLFTLTKISPSGIRKADAVKDSFKRVRRATTPVRLAGAIPKKKAI